MPKAKVENPALVLFNKLKTHYKCNDDVKAIQPIPTWISLLKIPKKVKNALNDFGSIIVFFRWER